MFYEQQMSEILITLLNLYYCKNGDRWKKVSIIRKINQNHFWQLPVQTVPTQKRDKNSQDGRAKLTSSGNAADC